MARRADLLPGFETAGWEITSRFSPRPQGQDFFPFPLMPSLLPALPLILRSRFSSPAPFHKQFYKAISTVSCSRSKQPRPP
jgi:hypothetical protein